MKLLNGKILGKVYYGLHMYPGVAEYAEKGKEPLRVLVGEDTVKRMNATFPGKPVFVMHVPEVDPATMQEDGWVAESFFNKLDGKNWVKFLVTTEQGLQAIKKGWRLSNAYIAKSTSGGGVASGVEYQQEVMEGEYEHLAIVPNPRYEESVILTPEEFKAYNAEKESELLKLANAADKPKGESSMLKLFKRTKVENSADFDQMMVALPESKAEITLTEAVERADKFTNMQGYASDDHMVKANDDEEMSVKDLKKAYNKLRNEEKERAEAAAKKENDDQECEGEDGAAEVEKGMGKKENDAEDGDGDADDVKANKKKNKMKNAREAAIKDTEESDKFFNELEDAEKKVKPIQNEDDVEMSQTKVQRGKSRYGSGS